MATTFNPFIHELYITTHVEPPPLYCCIVTDNFAEGISEIFQTINEIKKMSTVTGVSIVAGWRVDLPACNGPITRLEPPYERQVRPDNFISASNSCQKIWQNRFYVIGKQKEMKKKRHSGIFQAF